LKLSLEPRFLTVCIVRTFLIFAHKLVYIQPMDKGVKPAVARPVGIAEAKTMLSVLVKVEFHRLTCLVPRLDDSKLPLK